MGVAFFSTISTVWDREFGFLKEILVAPVSRTAIALGKTLGATTIAALQAFILLAIASFVGINIHLAIISQLLIFNFYASFVIRYFRNGAFYRFSYENNGKLRASYASAYLSNVFSLWRFLSSHRRAIVDVCSLKNQSSNLRS
jgi:ABC-type Na+ efflux pump permease subunit